MLRRSVLGLLARGAGARRSGRGAGRRLGQGRRGRQEGRQARHLHRLDRLAVPQDGHHRLRGRSTASRVELLEARASEVRERVRVEQAAGRFLGDIHHNGSHDHLADARATATSSRTAPFPTSRTSCRPTRPTTSASRPRSSATACWSTRNMVKPADEPKSWKDILDPKWTGKILSDDYRALGGGAVFFVVMHDTFGKEFHEKLAAQKPVILARPRATASAASRAASSRSTCPFSLQDYNNLKGLPVKADRAGRGPALRPLRPDDAQERAASQRRRALFMNHYLEPEVAARLRQRGLRTRWSRAWSRRRCEEIRALLATKALGTTDARAAGRDARAGQADLQVGAGAERHPARRRPALRPREGGRRRRSRRSSTASSSPCSGPSGCGKTTTLAHGRGPGAATTPAASRSAAAW